MKISNFIPYIAYQKAAPTKNQNTAQNFSYPKGLERDIFVRKMQHTKNRSIVSFSSKMDEIYPEFKRELVDYVSNSKELEVQKLEDIILKYAPQTSFSYEPFSLSNCAQVVNPIVVTMSEGGLYNLQNEPAELLIGLAQGKLDKKTKFFFLERMLHEGAHLLQGICEDRCGLQKLISSYLALNPKEAELEEGLYAMEEIFEDVEEPLIELYEAARPKRGEYPKKLPRNYDFNKAIEEKCKTSLDDYTFSLVSHALSTAKEKYPNSNPVFLLTFIERSAKNELEAYEAAISFEKEYLGINSKTNDDLILEIYEAIIKAAQTILLKQAAFPSKKMSELYNPFRIDIVRYVLNNKNYSIEELNGILRKYSPESSFDEYDNLPQELNYMKNQYNGFAVMPSVLDISEDEKCAKITTGPKKIYIDIPKNPNSVEIIEFINKLLHENTHIFQAEASDRINITELLNSYLVNSSNLKRDVATYQTLPSAYFAYEEIMLSAFQKCFPHATGLPEKIPSNMTDVEKAFKRKTEEGARECAIEALELIFETAQKNFGRLNRDMFYSYMAQRAQYEKEANSNGVAAMKEILNISQKTDLDVLIELYDVMRKAAESLREKHADYKYMQDIYGLYEAELSDYVLNAPELSIEELNRIIKKYSPNTVIKNMVDEEGECISKYSLAYTNLQLDFENGKFKQAPKEIYIYLIGTNTKLERVSLLGQILHESTHVFQTEADDRNSNCELFNEYLAKGQNQDRVLETMGYINSAANSLEDYLIEAFMECFDNEALDILPETIDENTRLQELFKEKIGVDLEEFISVGIIEVLEAIDEQSQKNADLNLVLDSIILQAQEEKEAYTNELASYKKNLSVSSLCDFDLRVELYDVFEKTAIKLKEKLSA